MKSTTLPARQQVPLQDTWDLTVMYPTAQDWDADFERLQAILPALLAYKGKLAHSREFLAQALILRDDIGKLVGKLFQYAARATDEDLKNTENKARKERIYQLYVKVSTAASFISPEILAISDLKLSDMIEHEPRLHVYRFELAELQRGREHVLSPEIEALLAAENEITSGPRDVYTTFTNVDLKLGHIKDGTGKKVEITHGNYGSMLDSTQRPVRRAAYRAMFGAHKGVINTLAGAYAAQVKIDVHRARARKYPSAMAHALDRDNIPLLVPTMLQDTVAKNTDKLRRYLELRKRLMRVKKLAPYDLYMPLVRSVDFKVDYERGKQLVLDSLAPLGGEYVETLRRGFESRWVDVRENRNKKSGAYSSGTWGTPPYMLLNWQDELDSVFTLAHEAGHSMHSWHTRNAQPYPYANYSIFVAEVASTFNEALLAHHLLNTTDDRNVKRYIINQQLEGIRATLYRQTLFAAFEAEAHAAYEAGTPLTPDFLCALHRRLNEEYYGGVVELDELIQYEWARIPHFYNAFYVFKYATGISAATALAGQVLTEGAPALERYLKFLSTGSSAYGVDMLRDAGVDLTTPAPVQEALNAFDANITAFEALL